jgi:hypothetical protein
MYLALAKKMDEKQSIRKITEDEPDFDRLQTSSTQVKF